MSDVAKALAVSPGVNKKRTREVGALLEDFREQDFYVTSVLYKKCQNNGKIKVTVYVTEDTSPKQRFWMTQKDVSRLYNISVKKIQGMCKSRKSTGQLDISEVRRLPKTQEALLSVYKWRTLLYSFKPIAHCGKFMRDVFDNLLRDLEKVFPNTQPQVDSTVPAVEETASGSYWVAKPEEPEEPAQDEIATVEINDIPDEELERLTKPEPSQEPLDDEDLSTDDEDEPAAPEKSAATVPVQPAPEPELDEPEMTVYKVVQMRFTPSQILAALRKSYPRIAASATYEMRGDRFHVEWDEVE